MLKTFFIGVCVVLSCNMAWADGNLSANTRIVSEHLGYALQYRVYVPDGIEAGVKVPTLYLVDGQWYIQDGDIIEVLNQEIRQATIDAVVVVFVDSRDPDKLANNRRNDEFFCKQEYVDFFEQELVPQISAAFPVSQKREERVIGGISFGGLNAACFGLMAAKTFHGIAMQSPANKHHLKVISKLYKDNERLPLKIFFSVGTKNDNTRAARQFQRDYQSVGRQDATANEQIAVHVLSRLDQTRRNGRAMSSCSADVDARAKA